MHSSGFESAPVSQSLLVVIVSASVLATVFDVKEHGYIFLKPDLWPNGQYWRLLSWQICYTNFVEILFAVIAIYNLRVIERLWGSKKFLSFLLIILPWTLMLTPLITIGLSSISNGKVNYIPAGPTPILFAILAQYHAIVPFEYRYKLESSFGKQPITITSKSSSYLVPAQLALSQFPSSLIPAATGWMIGHAYRWSFLPGSSWIESNRQKGATNEAHAQTHTSRSGVEAGSSKQTGASSGVEIVK